MRYTKENRKTHWASWEKLNTAKSKGGVGFQEFEAFNQAILAKQAWRIQQNPNPLLARVLKAKYFLRCSFMDNKIGSNPSYIWRSIRWGKGLLEKGSYWRVGTSDSIQVYSDRWIPRPILFKPFSPAILPQQTTMAKLGSLEVAETGIRSDRISCRRTTRL